MKTYKTNNNPWTMAIALALSAMLAQGQSTSTSKAVPPPKVALPVSKTPVNQPPVKANEKLQKAIAPKPREVSTKAKANSTSQSAKPKALQTAASQTSNRSLGAGANAGATTGVKSVPSSLGSLKPIKTDLVPDVSPGVNKGQTSPNLLNPADAFANGSAANTYSVSLQRNVEDFHSDGGISPRGNPVKDLNSAGGNYGVFVNHNTRQVFTDLAGGGRFNSDPMNAATMGLLTATANSGFSKTSAAIDDGTTALKKTAEVAGKVAAAAKFAETAGAAGAGAAGAGAVAGVAGAAATGIGTGLLINEAADFVSEELTGVNAASLFYDLFFDDTPTDFEVLKQIAEAKDANHGSSGNDAVKQYDPDTGRGLPSEADIAFKQALKQAVQPNNPGSGDVDPASDTGAGTRVDPALAQSVLAANSQDNLVGNPGSAGTGSSSGPRNLQDKPSDLGPGTQQGGDADFENQSGYTGSNHTEGPEDMDVSGPTQTVAAPNLSVNRDSQTSGGSATSGNSGTQSGSNVRNRQFTLKPTTDRK